MTPKSVESVVPSSPLTRFCTASASTDPCFFETSDCRGRSRDAGTSAHTRGLILGRYMDPGACNSHPRPDVRLPRPGGRVGLPGRAGRRRADGADPRLSVVSPGLAVGRGLAGAPAPRPPDLGRERRQHHGRSGPRTDAPRRQLHDRAGGRRGATCKSTP